MKFLKDIILYKIIFIGLFLVCAGCQKNQPLPEVNEKEERMLPDTARIHQALRNFDALPPDTKGKASILDEIRQEAISMGYNEEACYLSMDLARGQADRGNLDSARIYFEEARPFCNEPLFDKTLPATFLSEYASFYHSLRSD